MYITSIMVSIGSSIILAGLVYILLVKKMHKERSSTAITEQVRAEIDRMIVDLNQTADRNIGLIEQRIQSLGELIKEADHRMTLLQKETDSLARNADTYSRIRPSHLSAAQSSSGNAVAEKQTEQKRQTRIQVDSEKAEQKLSDSSEATEKTVETGGQSKRERVIHLNRQGISADIIASRVDSTVAEVELIISMTEGQR